MTQRTTSPSPSFTPQGRYPVRIPIRMTEAERAIIGKSACALNCSISRYLVELATSEKAPKPALLSEDKARLRFLHALFHGATEKLQTVLSSERFAAGTGEEITGARATLEETLRLLDAIGQELGRRIL